MQNDTFYVPSVAAGLAATVKMGGGFDRVYLGTTQGNENAGSLAGFQGSLTLEGNGPEANDRLYFNDQTDGAGQTFTITNANTGTTQSGFPIDTTTVARGGASDILYRSFETVVLNNGLGDDTVNLRATHREQSVLGGLASNFTINTGAGINTINLGEPVMGGFSLDRFVIDNGPPTPSSVKGIPVMINGQSSLDSVHFQDTATTEVTELAFVDQSFTQLFPASPATNPPTASPGLLALYTDLFGEDPQSTQYATVALSRSGQVSAINVSTRNAEELRASLGSGADIVQLTAGAYGYSVTVNGGDGAETFNVENGVDMQGNMATFNGEGGDDLLFADLSMISLADPGDLSQTVTSVTSIDAIVPQDVRRLGTGTILHRDAKHGGRLAVSPGRCDGRSHRSGHGRWQRPDRRLAGHQRGSGHRWRANTRYAARILHQLRQQHNALPGGNSHWLERGRDPGGHSRRHDQRRL